MFEVVNEIAVLGATFLMMAVMTVWYSPKVFGSVWLKSIGKTEADIEVTKPHTLKYVLTFVGFFSMLSILAHVVVFAPMLALTPLSASFLIALFVASLALLPIVWEGKGLSYYVVSVGFYSVFIIGGTLVLQHWPW